MPRPALSDAKECFVVKSLIIMHWSFKVENLVAFFFGRFFLIKIPRDKNYGTITKSRSVQFTFRGQL
jgi:hypothetical protein